MAAEDRRRRNRGSKSNSASPSPSPGPVSSGSTQKEFNNDEVVSFMKEQYNSAISRSKGPNAEVKIYRNESGSGWSTSVHSRKHRANSASSAGNNTAVPGLDIYGELIKGLKSL